MYILPHCPPSPLVRERRAALAGIDSLFIAGGIHAEALQTTRPSDDSCSRPATYSIESMQRLSLEQGVMPTYSMAFLEW